MILGINCELKIVAWGRKERIDGGHRSHVELKSPHEFEDSFMRHWMQG